MSVTSIVVIWMALAAATIGLAVYRRFFAIREETNSIRLSNGDLTIFNQLSAAKKIRVIDRVGEALTVLTAVIGFTLAAAYLNNAWENPNPGPNNFFRMNTPR